MMIIHKYNGQSKNKLKLYRFKCIECGDMFFTHIGNAKYCSKECRSKANIKLLNKTRKQKPNYYEKRFRIFARDNFKCQYCGRGVEDGVILQIDHIFPKSKGGLNEENNLTTACSECNLGKTDILIEEHKNASK